MAYKSTREFVDAMRDDTKAAYEKRMPEEGKKELAEYDNKVEELKAKVGYDKWDEDKKEKFDLSAERGREKIATKYEHDNDNEKKESSEPPEGREEREIAR